ncbi:DNA-binding transcriptional regulator, XRE-family HTH domain [Lutibacter oricola]|uniref:DNA-binding transcriptional regulator, XRE-family HTH domain n=1 Tax=Lutibacter oricola TaxID=762486 RepID=A0A1H2WL56_9FLAO|nr:helix-turn-helix domain-containing protein [Lutibacter oricola]SDW81257.1 DNA-binding transcriptional regulator, XRE-family HTH domain [Lutibacter oricola]
MTELHKIFCGNIKRLRGLKSISQVELADRMQIRQTTLSRLENGKTEPGIGTMEKVALALEVPIFDLFVNPNIEALAINEKLLKLTSLNSYDQKLLEAIIDNFLEKQRLEEQLQLKMNKRLDELKEVRHK